MSMTGGAFSAPISPDLTKEVQSFVVSIPAGAGVAQVVNPNVPVQSMTTYNYTSNLIRGTVTFSAGIISTGVAATRTFLIPPGASASIDFADHDGDNAVGSIDGIDSVSYVAVNPGVVTAESSTLVAAAAAVAGSVYVNFAAS
jgi:hypothetical protein